MMAKPRYWQVAYPLAVTALCVAPHEMFLRHWNMCFENGINKLKVGCSFNLVVDVITHFNLRRSHIAPPFSTG